jgi:hypothetical protein
MIAPGTLQNNHLVEPSDTGCEVKSVKMGDTRGTPSCYDPSSGAFKGTPNNSRR